MSNNIQIGSTNTSPPNSPFTAVIHGKKIYDSINWTADGILCWDSVNGIFFVTPYASFNPPLTPPLTNTVASTVQSTIPGRYIDRSNLSKPGLKKPY